MLDLASNRAKMSFNEKKSGLNVENNVKINYKFSFAISSFNSDSLWAWFPFQWSFWPWNSLAQQFNTFECQIWTDIQTSSSNHELYHIVCMPKYKSKPNLSIIRTSDYWTWFLNQTRSMSELNKTNFKFE